MKFFLVRHGESEGNVNPLIHKSKADHAIGLSERGKEQSLEVGTKLSEIFKNIYGSVRRPHIRLWTSPYLRSRETAINIMKTSKSWITDSKEHILLSEQQFGLFDGVPDEELPKIFPLEFSHYSKQIEFEGKFWARVPLGESRFDVAMRVHQSFGTFHRDKNQFNIENLVIICHGVTLRAFIMMYCDYPFEWFEKERNPMNCAIRLLESEEDKGYLFEGFKN